MQRVKRLRGQLTAIESGLENEEDCSSLLHALVSCRGGLNSLISEVIEGHIRSHLVDARQRPSLEQIEAADELVSALKTYLK